MSVYNMKNYDEWPIWSELAEVMATIAVFRIVKNGICNYGWHESDSAIVNMTRDDIVDYAVKQRMASMRMADSLSNIMSMLGGFVVGDIDLSNESTLVVQASGFIGYLFGHESVEPLSCTSIGKSWERMLGFLRQSNSFKGLVTFVSESRRSGVMRERIQKYGLGIAITSSAYKATEASFKEAYPNDFKKGFWAFLFG